VGPLLQATRTVPIVFPVAGDPVGAGFVDSLARPGGNATGFMTFEEAIASGLISDNDALDLAPGLAGFVPPTMQQLQQAAHRQ
jgi:ABC transporter substrate binding protein